MPRTLFFAIVIFAILFILGGATFLFFNRASEQQTVLRQEQQAPQDQIGQIPMKIQSPAFEHNQTIPPKYTCDGEDINPLLAISDVPENAKSLALIVDDPDAPMGTWVHWIVWNIDPATTEIAENSVPTGAVEGKTSWNRLGYGGPCPPSGTHRYFFKLYALDTTLDLPPGADKFQLESVMKNRIVDQTELIGLYSRVKK